MTSHDARLGRAKKLVPTVGVAPQVETPANIVDFAFRMLAVPLYPAQALILKIITLAVAALTDWDRRTIESWSAGFTPTDDIDGTRWQGEHGCAPDLITRMTHMAARGAPWFNEINFVVGRRAGKGYLVRILIAWAIWRLLTLKDPQRHYRIDPHKELNVLVFGTKADQARRDQFADVKSLIENAPCFQPFLGMATDTWISILTPAQIA